jgi:hypothetical protein
MGRDLLAPMAFLGIAPFAPCAAGRAPSQVAFFLVLLLEQQITHHLKGIGARALPNGLIKRHQRVEVGHADAPIALHIEKPELLNEGLQLLQVDHSKLDGHADDKLKLGHARRVASHVGAQRRRVDLDAL